MSLPRGGATDSDEQRGRMSIVTEEQHVELQQEWPRAGHAFTYTRTFTLDGIDPFEFELSVSTEADETHVSNVIVGRMGGANAADIELRKQL